MDMVEWEEEDVQLRFQPRTRIINAVIQTTKIQYAAYVTLI